MPSIQPPSRPSQPCIADTNVAQLISPSSSDEINRARPGLAAVALRHAHIDRKIGAARQRHDVVDGEAPAPVLLEQTIDADPPAEAAAGVTTRTRRSRLALLFQNARQPERDRR